MRATAQCRAAGVSTGSPIRTRLRPPQDRYSVETYKQPESLVTGLKKLSKDNLSNLTPHPLYVFLHYSHPPVLARIDAIRKHHAKVNGTSTAPRSDAKKKRFWLL